LLFRALKENLRLQDIARLEDLGQSEAAKKLLQYASQAFAKAHGIQKPFTPEDYFYGLAKKVTHNLFPLFLRGYRFASYSWHDVARNISLTGEKVDVFEFKTRTFPDVGYFLHAQGQDGNGLYLTTTVLLRLAEQIRRHTNYQLPDAPDILQNAAIDVIENTDFNEVLEKINDIYIQKQPYYRGRPVGAAELKGITQRRVHKHMEEFRQAYQRDRISQWVFEPMSY